jgi:hypothetical protein
MASLEECMEALGHASTLLEESAASGHVGTLPDRTVALELTDLDVRITGALKGGFLTDIAEAASTGSTETRADATLGCTSDDFLSLCAGKLGFTLAWASGRLSIEASIRDVIRLRSLL